MQESQDLRREWGPCTRLEREAFLKVMIALGLPTQGPQMPSTHNDCPVRKGREGRSIQDLLSRMKKLRC